MLSLRRCGSIGATAEALYIFPPAIFAFLMPPVQIPWPAIKNATKSSKSLDFDVSDLAFRLPGDVLSSDSLKLITVRDTR